MVLKKSVKIGIRFFKVGSLRALAIVGLSGIVISCAIPEAMRVRAGIDPRNQDDNVRFRTTYYFRTFDVCHTVQLPSATDMDNQEGSLPFYQKTRGAYKLQNDSLYRFKMTGKANSLTTKVHFESGTLRASEIDPFGASVEFDKKSGRYRFVSKQETELTAKKNDIYEEIKSLLQLNAGLAEKDRTNQVNEEVRRNVKGRIKALFDQLNKQGAMTPGQSDASLPGKTVGCPSNMVSRRGFQILGPEGWRTFNQDERLLLAMTIDGAPLISAMKSLSSRVLNEQPNRNGALLTLARERIKISEAKGVLQGLEKDFQVAGDDKPAVESGRVIDKVIAAFGGEGK